VSKIGVGSVLAAYLAASCFAQNSHYQPDPEWRPPTEAQIRENPLRETRTGRRREEIIFP